MAGKRQATSDLNHENWDREEEPEPRGTYQAAPESVIQNRVIKKARRRNARETPAEGAGDDQPRSNVFSSFAGFSKNPSPATGGASAFSFLNKISSVETAVATSSDAKTSDTNKAEKTKEMKASPVKSQVKSDIYAGKLIGLNQSVSDWIKRHVEQNPTCNLTPIFKDYEKYLNEIEMEENNRTASPQNSEGVGKAITAFGKTSNLTAAATTSASSSFGVSNVAPKTTLTIGSVNKPTTTEALKSNGFNIDATSSTNEKPTTSGFTFGVKPDDKSKVTSTFSFGLKSTDKTSASSTTAPTFGFGAKGADTTTLSPAAPKFSFGTKPADLTSAASTAPKFTFGANAADTTSVSPTGPKITFDAKPTSTTSASSTTSSISFGFNSTSTISASSTTPTFSFGYKPPAGGAATVNNSIFGNSPPTSTEVYVKKPTGFSSEFFGNIQAASKHGASTSSQAEEQEETEDEHPPKVEFKQVVEEDAIYSKKCKVFFKKEDGYADRGVGTLYLKPVKETGKTQLLVRADTNLGNILVNAILSEGMPAQRIGKNNVMLVGISTPDSDKSTILLRVKTGEEADDLLKAIEKHKK